MSALPQACVLGLCGYVALVVAAGDTSKPCDDLTPSPGGSGYRLRDGGDRCEGLFEGNRSFSSVILVGLTAGLLPFQPGMGKSLELHWRSREAVHLRASSVTKEFFYRMDSDRPARDSSYRWKLELLAQLGRSADDIALAAFSGPVGNHIYYPLTGKDGTDGKLRFTFLTTALTTESLEFSGCNESGGQPALKQIVRKPGPFERSQMVPLEFPARAGRWCLKAVARYSGGGSQSDNIVFQVP
jgi:hypothetical protein